MKRLIKKAFNIGQTVRFKSNPFIKGKLTIIQINQDGTYNLQDSNGVYQNVENNDLTDAKNFIIGDKVRYKKHPYDNKEIYEVKDVLPNGNYYIENDDQAYTNINGINLELA